LVLSPTGSINRGFILREDLLLCSSYLPLRVPNWVPNKLYQDPISPYLFLLAAEGLSCFLKNLHRSSALHGLQVVPTAPAVNHLLFANDSLLFFQASINGAQEMIDALNKYCSASGQQINMDKSSIFFSKGCPEAVRQDIKIVLEVERETLNEKYLGMPSDVGKSKGLAFKYLRDRV
jgi:hypothetical protein